VLNAYIDHRDEGVRAAAIASVSYHDMLDAHWKHVAAAVASTSERLQLAGLRSIHATTKHAREARALLDKLAKAKAPAVRRAAETARRDLECYVAERA
jgi:DNA-binding ferritin-like protein